MMRPGKTLAAGLIAAAALTHAVHADVTRSDKNDPKASIAGEMRLILGSEHARMRNLGAAPVTSAIPSTASVAPGKAVAKTPQPATPGAIAARAPGAAPSGNSGFLGLFRGKVQEAPKAKFALRHDMATLMAQKAPSGGADWQCLTEAVYFEARGESLKGQFAVAEVILNRVDSGLYPGSVCGVVKQRGGGSCQFSYVCDGLSDVMRDPRARDLAGRIARMMLDGAERSLTEGATHFHTRNVRPGWAKRFAQTATIGAHHFYRQPGARG